MTRCSESAAFDTRELPKRILIVDDEPAVAAVLSRYCRNEGCEARIAGSAEEAISLTGRESFDLIMLDIVLPGLSGFGAIEVLKRFGDVAILMMSGCADEETRKDAVMMGALGLIGKPVEFEKLLPILQALPGRTKPFQQSLA